MAVLVKYQKGLVFQQFTNRVLTTASKEILSDQRQAITMYYNTRQNKVLDSLSDNIAQVKTYAGGTQLSFDYTIDLRFLDMRKTASGTRKKVYGPVYNKILWGHFYRSIIPALRYGLNSSIEQEIIEELRQSYNKINEQ